MRMLAITALLLLGACGHKQENATGVSVNDGAGEIRRDGLKMGDLDLSVDPGSKQCANRPDYVPAYPGANVQACTVIGKGGQLMFTTPGSPADVLAFYKKAAADAKLTDGVREEANLFAAWGHGDSRGYTVTAEPEGDEVRVSVTYGKLI